MATRPGCHPASWPFRVCGPEHPSVDASMAPTYATRAVTPESQGEEQMTKTTITSLIILGLSAVASAAEKPPAAPPAGAPDMTKVGPMSRKVTKEDKKGVDELYKSVEDAMKKGDINAFADLADF